MNKRILSSQALIIGSVFLSSYSLTASSEVSFKPAGFSIGHLGDSHSIFMDKNNDGRVDAFTFDGGSLSVYDGREDGFTLASEESLWGSSFVSVDINNDGYSDIISYPFKISLNDGSGHFPVPTTSRYSSLNVVDNHINFQVDDLDRNGVPDLFLTSWGSTSGGNPGLGATHVYMNVSYDPGDTVLGHFKYEREDIYNGQFMEGFSQTSRGVAIGDVNGDGYPDVILINSNTGASSASVIALNDGSGNLSFSQYIAGAEDISLADFDADGDLDAYLAVNGDAPDEVWMNDNGVFSNSGQLLGASNSLKSRAGDIDGDGDIDVVTINENPEGTSQDQAHKIWLNDGQGLFQASTFSFGTGHRTRSFNLLDLDHDGDLDIATFGGGSAYDLSDPRLRGIRVTTNEIWLNQLVPNNAGSEEGISNGIELCRSNPNEYGLFSSEQVDEVLLEAAEEGIQLCVSSPGDYGLYTQEQIDSARSAGVLEGNSECMNNPESCDLFVQEELDAAYQQGVIDGKALCQADPASCGLFNERGLKEVVKQKIKALIAKIRSSIWYFFKLFWR